MKYTLPNLCSTARVQELSMLVNSAYDQMKAATSGGTWASPPGYKINAVLSSVEFWKVGPIGGFFSTILPPPPKVPFGFVATNGGAVYVVIRGTITPLEWFDDFTADPVPFRPNGQNWGQIPRGFSTLNADLGPQIITALQALQAAGVPLNNIFVTGHSLGAALAHIAAAGISAQFNLQPVSYTFSGPRAGDPAFAGAYAAANLPTWRIVNTEDIVPTVPPAAIEFNTPNAGMHGLTAMTQSLSSFLRLGAIGYQHIGYPIAATFHCDVVADNHDMNRLVAEVLSP